MLFDQAGAFRLYLSNIPKRSYSNILSDFCLKLWPGQLQADFFLSHIPSAPPWSVNINAAPHLHHKLSLKYLISFLCQYCDDFIINFPSNISEHLRLIVLPFKYSKEKQSRRLSRGLRTQTCLILPLNSWMIDWILFFNRRSRRQFTVLEGLISYESQKVHLHNVCPSTILSTRQYLRNALTTTLTNPIEEKYRPSWLGLFGYSLHPLTLSGHSKQPPRNCKLYLRVLSLEELRGLHPPQTCHI